MIGAALLSLALAADQPAPLTGVLSKAYGHWIVDCNLGSPRPDGLVDCDASTSVGDVEVSASRRGDDISYYVRSEKCPGMIADAKIPVSAFVKPDPTRLSVTNGYDRIGVAVVAFNAMCVGKSGAVDVDRPNMMMAFRHLLLRQTPAEISDAARKGIW